MKKWMVAGLVLAAVVAGSVAYAAIPSSNGTINGCYGKLGGILRVIDEGKSCTSFEKPLMWNVQGQPGISGYEVVQRTGSQTPSAGAPFIVANVGCPSGKSVIGGGGSGFVGSAFLDLLSSAPDVFDNEWVVVLAKQNGTPFNGAESVSWRVVVFCAKVAN